MRRVWPTEQGAGTPLKTRQGSIRMSKPQLAQHYQSEMFETDHAKQETEHRVGVKLGNLVLDLLRKWKSTEEF